MIQRKKKKERKEKGGQIGLKRQMVMTKVITNILWIKMEIFQDVLCDSTRHLASKCPTRVNQYKSFFHQL